jgi:hypothetical protein
MWWISMYFLYTVQVEIDVQSACTVKKEMNSGQG